MKVARRWYVVWSRVGVAWALALLATLGTETLLLGTKTLLGTEAYASGGGGNTPERGFEVRLVPANGFAQQSGQTTVINGEIWYKGEKDKNQQGVYRYKITVRDLATSGSSTEPLNFYEA